MPGTAIRLDIADGTAYDGLNDLYAAFRRVGSLAGPPVAVLDGPAVGAGVNLALAADLRIVTHEAIFVSGFARMGPHLGDGHLYLLARAAGVRSAAASGVFAQTMLARALAETLRRTVLDPSAWDRGVEINEPARCGR